MNIQRRKKDRDLSRRIGNPVINRRRGDYAPVGGSSNPTNILTYGGPVSNDPVTIGFKQPIAATDGLLRGNYAKTLTFTLSATTP